jgi:hypothetical protein
MAQRLVRFSDLTNKIIEDDAVVRIVVEQHPALENGPVEIEAAEDEVEPIRKGALSLVTVKLYQGDGSVPETVTMEIEEFNNLAGGVDMGDVIRRAGPAYPPRSKRNQPHYRLSTSWTTRLSSMPVSRTEARPRTLRRRPCGVTLRLSISDCRMTGSAPLIWTTRST